MNAVMGVITATLLLQIPMTGRLGWLPFATAVAAGLAFGVVAAYVARPAATRGWIALALFVVPTLALAALAAPAGFAYALAYAGGMVAGRARFPL